MRSGQFLIKCFSLLLVLVLLGTNCVFAHVPEANFWAERRAGLNKNRGTEAVQLARLPGSFPSLNQFALPENLPSLNPDKLNPLTGKNLSGVISSSAGQVVVELLKAIPSQYGTVRKVALPENDKPNRIIVHIQDVHLNSEAQENIAKTVQTLLDQKKAGLVALEGAFGPVELKNFRSYPDRNSIQKVAEYLLRMNRISGPIFTGLTSKETIPPFIGVDDQFHYKANVNAYRQSAPLAQANKRILAKRERELAERKKAVFNPRLLHFDGQVASYRKGTLSLKNVLSILAKTGGPEPESLRALRQALETEEKLDFAQIEQERTALIARLLPSLDEQRKSELVHTSLAFRTGRINHADFYRYVEELCDGCGLNLNRFPAMREYIAYLLASESIAPERTLSDMKIAEKNAYASLIATSGERALLQRSDELHLAGKLMDYSLTPEEWDEYKAVKSAEGAGGLQKLETFEAFYQEAQHRDAAITANLMRSMRDTNARVAVLVTGGFHAQGILRELQDTNAAIISFVPKITKVENGSASSYLTVFQQERSPLETLFQGRKLFMAFRPISLPEVAAFVAFQEELRDPLRDSMDHAVVNALQEGANLSEREFALQDAGGGQITGRIGGRFLAPFSFADGRYPVFKSSARWSQRLLLPILQAIRGAVRRVRGLFGKRKERNAEGVPTPSLKENLDLENKFSGRKGAGSTNTQIKGEPFFIPNSPEVISNTWGEGFDDVIERFRRERGLPGSIPDPREWEKGPSSDELASMSLVELGGFFRNLIAGETPVIPGLAWLSESAPDDRALLGKYLDLISIPDDSGENKYLDLLHHVKDAWGSVFLLKELLTRAESSEREEELRLNLKRYMKRQDFIRELALNRWKRASKNQNRAPAAGFEEQEGKPDDWMALMQTPLRDGPEPKYPTFSAPELVEVELKLLMRKGSIPLREFTKNGEIVVLGFSSEEFAEVVKHCSEASVFHLVNFSRLQTRLSASTIWDEFPALRNRVKVYHVDAADAAHYIPRGDIRLVLANGIMSSEYAGEEKDSAILRSMQQLIGLNGIGVIRFSPDSNAAEFRRIESLINAQGTVIFTKSLGECPILCFRNLPAGSDLSSPALSLRHPDFVKRWGDGIRTYLADAFLSSPWETLFYFAAPFSLWYWTGADVILLIPAATGVWFLLRHKTVFQEQSWFPTILRAPPVVALYVAFYVFANGTIDLHDVINLFNSIGLSSQLVANSHNLLSWLDLSPMPQAFVVVAALHTIYNLVVSLLGLPVLSARSDDSNETAGAQANKNHSQKNREDAGLEKRLEISVAIAYFARGLESSERHVRTTVALALSSLAAAKVVSRDGVNLNLAATMEGLLASDLGTRVEAAETLRILAEANLITRPSIEPYLKFVTTRIRSNEHSGVLRNCALVLSALAKAGVIRKEDITLDLEILIAGAQDDRSGHRLDCARALQALVEAGLVTKEEAKPNLQPLRSGLSGTDRYDRLNSAWALQALGGAGIISKRDIEPLDFTGHARNIESGHIENTRDSIQVLNALAAGGLLGKSDVRIDLTKITELLASEYSNVRLNAARTVRALSQAGLITKGQLVLDLTALHQGLKNKEPHNRALSIETLRELVEAGLLTREDVKGHVWDINDGLQEYGSGYRVTSAAAFKTLVQAGLLFWDDIYPSTWLSEQGLTHYDSDVRGNSHYSLQLLAEAKLLRQEQIRLIAERSLAAFHLYGGNAARTLKALAETGWVGQDGLQLDVTGVVAGLASGRLNERENAAKVLGNLADCGLADRETFRALTTQETSSLLDRVFGSAGLEIKRNLILLTMLQRGHFETRGLIPALTSPETVRVLTREQLEKAVSTKSAEQDPASARLISDLLDSSSFPDIKVSRIEFMDGGDARTNFGHFMKGILSLVGTLGFQRPSGWPVQSSVFESNIAILPEPTIEIEGEIVDLKRPLGRYGRTWFYKTASGTYVHLKFLKDDERPSTLAYEHDVMNFLADKRIAWGLEGQYPRGVIRLGAIRSDHLDDAMEGPSEGQPVSVPFNKWRGHYTFMAYEVDPDREGHNAYSTYINDRDLSEDEFLEGFRVNVHDRMVMAQHGLFDSEIIELFHNQGRARRYDWMVEYRQERHQPTRAGAGRLNDVIGATRFPNMRLSGPADLAELIFIDDLIDSGEARERADNRGTHLRNMADRDTARARPSVTAAHLGDALLSLALMPATFALRRGTLSYEQESEAHDTFLQRALRMMFEEAGKVFGKETSAAYLQPQLMARQMAYFMAGRWLEDFKKRISIPADLYPDAEITPIEPNAQDRGWNPKRGWDFVGEIHRIPSRNPDRRLEMASFDLGPVNGPNPLQELVRSLFLFTADAVVRLKSSDTNRSASLTFPFWNGVFGAALFLGALLTPSLHGRRWSWSIGTARRLADHLLVRSTIIPLLELFALPGFALALAPHLGLGAAIPAGAFLVAIFHGLPSFNPRSPPRWYQQSQGQFLIRFAAASFITAAAFLLAPWFEQSLFTALTGLSPLSLAVWVLHGAYDAAAPEGMRLMAGGTREPSDPPVKVTISPEGRTYLLLAAMRVRTVFLQHFPQDRDLIDRLETEGSVSFCALVETLAHHSSLEADADRGPLIEAFFRQLSETTPIAEKIDTKRLLRDVLALLETDSSFAELIGDLIGSVRSVASFNLDRSDSPSFFRFVAERGLAGRNGRVVDLAAGVNALADIADLEKVDASNGPVSFSFEPVDHSPFVISALSRFIEGSSVADRVKPRRADIRELSKLYEPGSITVLRMSNVESYVDLPDDWFPDVFPLLAEQATVVLCSRTVPGASVPIDLSDRLSFMRARMFPPSLRPWLETIMRDPSGRWTITVGHIDQDGRFVADQSGFDTEGFFSPTMFILRRHPENLIADGEFNMPLFEQLVKRAASRLGEKMGVPIEAYVVGSLRYLISKRPQKDLDVLLVCRTTDVTNETLAFPRRSEIQTRFRQELQPLLNGLGVTPVQGFPEKQIFNDPSGKDVEAKIDVAVVFEPFEDHRAEVLNGVREELRHQTPKSWAQALYFLAADRGRYERVARWASGGADARLDKMFGSKTWLKEWGRLMRRLAQPTAKDLQIVAKRLAESAARITSTDEPMPSTLEGFVRNITGTAAPGDFRVTPPVPTDEEATGPQESGKTVGDTSQAIERRWNHRIEIVEKYNHSPEELAAIHDEAFGGQADWESKKGGFTPVATGRSNGPFRARWSPNVSHGHDYGDNRDTFADQISNALGMIEEWAGLKDFSPAETLMIGPGRNIYEIQALSQPGAPKIKTVHIVSPRLPGVDEKPFDPIAWLVSPLDHWLNNQGAWEAQQAPEKFRFYFTSAVRLPEEIRNRIDLVVMKEVIDLDLNPPYVAERIFQEVFAVMKPESILVLGHLDKEALDRLPGVQRLLKPLPSIAQGPAYEDVHLAVRNDSPFLRIGTESHLRSILLGDELPDLRARAAKGYLDYGYPDAKTVLMEALRRVEERDRGTHTAILEQLARVKDDPEIGSILLQAFASESVPNDRFYIARAIEKLGYHPAVSAFEAVRDTTDSRDLRDGLSEIVNRMSAGRGSALNWINLMGAAVPVATLVLLGLAGVAVPWSTQRVEDLILIYLASVLIHEAAHWAEMGFQWHYRPRVLEGGWFRGGIGVPGSSGWPGITASAIISAASFSLFPFLQQGSDLLLPILVTNLIFSFSPMDWLPAGSLGRSHPAFEEFEGEFDARCAELAEYFAGHRDGQWTNSPEQFGRSIMAYVDQFKAMEQAICERWPRPFDLDRDLEHRISMLKAQLRIAISHLENVIMDRIHELRRNLRDVRTIGEATVHSGQQELEELGENYIPPSFFNEKLMGLIALLNDVLYQFEQSIDENKSWVGIDDNKWRSIMAKKLSEYDAIQVEYRYSTDAEAMTRESTRLSLDVYQLLLDFYLETSVLFVNKEVDMMNQLVELQGKHRFGWVYEARGPGAPRTHSEGPTKSGWVSKLFNPGGWFRRIIGLSLLMVASWGLTARADTVLLPARLSLAEQTANDPQLGSILENIDKRPISLGLQQSFEHPFRVVGDVNDNERQIEVVEISSLEGMDALVGLALGWQRAAPDEKRDVLFYVAPVVESLKEEATLAAGLVDALRGKSSHFRECKGQTSVVLHAHEKLKAYSVEEVIENAQKDPKIPYPGGLVKKRLAKGSAHVALFATVKSRWDKNLFPALVLGPDIISLVRYIVHVQTSRVDLMGVEERIKTGRVAGRSA